VTIDILLVFQTVIQTPGAAELVDCLLTGWKLCLNTWVRNSSISWIQLFFLPNFTAVWPVKFGGHETVFCWNVFSSTWGRRRQFHLKLLWPSTKLHGFLSWKTITIICDVTWHTYCTTSLLVLLYSNDVITWCCDQSWRQQLALICSYGACVCVRACVLLTVYRHTTPYVAER
jgi:hypothetical protein